MTPEAALVRGGAEYIGVLWCISGSEGRVGVGVGEVSEDFGILGGVKNIT